MSGDRPETQPSLTLEKLQEPGEIEKLVREGRVPRFDVIFPDGSRQISIPPVDFHPNEGDIERRLSVGVFRYFAPDGTLRGDPLFFNIPPEINAELDARVEAALSGPEPFERVIRLEDQIR